MLRALKQARYDPRNLGHSLVIGIRDNEEQLLDTVSPDGGNDPKLCEMGADCIDHRSLLTDEEMARASRGQTLCRCRSASAWGLDWAWR